MLNFCRLPYYRTDVRIRQKYWAIATSYCSSVHALTTSIHELIKLNINPSSNAETIEIWRWTVSVVYGTTANVAGARFEIFESARHFRIESGGPIRIRIESRSFAGF